MVSSSFDEASILHSEVELLPDERSAPLDSFGCELSSIVLDLRKPPSLTQFLMSTIRDMTMLGWQLAQLLPFAITEKAVLLSMNDPVARVFEIARWLEKSSQQFDSCFE